MRLTAVCFAIVALGTAACSSGSGGSSGSGTESGTSTGSTGSGTGTSTGSTGSGTGTSTGSTGTGTGSSGSAATVSFSNDILPLFSSNCGSAGIGCHGTGIVGATAGRPFLGNAVGTTSPSSVLPGIVNFASYEDPKLDIVKAGDSMNSYLVIKLLNEQDNYTSDCTAFGKNVYAPSQPCGLSMPGEGAANLMLDTATLTLIENWIDQGAQNN
jgi:hypothetical protein